MNYRFGLKDLTDSLEVWDNLLTGRGRIHLIACGGTALTLLGTKESTKDVDFVVPDPKEYERLIKFLKSAGYEQVTNYGWKHPDDNILFDLYKGNRVYSTELVSSPLQLGRNKKIYEWKKIYVGVLNAEDLVISKMFRGTEVDIQDCLLLFKNETIDFQQLDARYRETASYEVGEEKVLKNLALLRKRLEQEGLIK